MKTIQSFLFALCLVGFSTLNNSANADKPVYELIDHSRGVKITTYSDKWSNTVSRYGIRMIYNPGFSKLEIDKAFLPKKTVAETISKHLETQKKSDKAEILSEEIKINVGGIESRGYSFVVLKSREVFVKTWFKKGDRLFEVVVQAKEKNQKDFMKLSQKILDGLVFIGADTNTSETAKK